MRGCYFIIIFSLSALITGCHYTVNKVNGQNPGDSSGMSESALIDWNLMKSSVLRSCQDCHANYKPPELGNLASVQQRLTEVNVAVHNNSMPPAKDGYPPLSNCKKAVLDFWIQQGAPETTNAKVGSLTPCQGSTNLPGEPDNQPIETLPLTYSTLLTKILQPKCLKCHNPKSDDLEAAGTLFYPYSEIENRSHLWAKPGKKSKIVRELTRPDEDIMPPPDSGTPLTQQEVDFVIRWIDAGRPQ